MTKKKTATKKAAVKVSPMGLVMPTPPVMFASIQEDGSLIYNHQRQLNVNQGH